MAGGCRTRKEPAGWSLAVSRLTLDVGEWAQENFGECDLGDVRRTRRAVTVARQMAEHPDGSTPDQAEDGSDLKAMYRLFDAEKATFTALATPDWQRTRTLARGTVLLIGDTTQTDFGIRRAVTGLGPTGDGYGLGFFLHSSRMVDAASGEILGLAGQELFSRQPVPKDENSHQRLQRARESEVWGRVVELAAWSNWSGLRPKESASFTSSIAVPTTSACSATAARSAPIG